MFMNMIRHFDNFSALDNQEMTAWGCNLLWHSITYIHLRWPELPSVVADDMIWLYKIEPQTSYFNVLNLQIFMTIGHDNAMEMFNRHSKPGSIMFLWGTEADANAWLLLCFCSNIPLQPYVQLNTFEMSHQKSTKSNNFDAIHLGKL